MGQKVPCRALDGSVKHMDASDITTRPAVYGIIVNQGKILLMTMSANGKYHLPGGSIDNGETIEQALRREVAEETGITIGSARYKHFEEIFYYYDPAKAAHHGLHYFYTCDPLSTELVADSQVQDASAEKNTLD